MTTLDEPTSGMSLKSNKTGSRAKTRKGDDHESGDRAFGKRINRELLARLEAEGITLKTAASEVLKALVSISANPPPWCDLATWSKFAFYLGQWAQSFGALDVWHALETCGGSQEAAGKLHSQTLPDLRQEWMPRVGLKAPPREKKPKR